MLNFIRQSAAILALAVTFAGATQAEEASISPRARRVTEVLDSMQVESLWPAGVHVNWRTGVPDGGEGTLHGRHTHCSAFVASAAEKLGVYILRPPQHPQELLANAQNEWLASDGRAEGWRPLSGPVEAQEAANRGDLVVASYHNHHDNKPGHIAIVRPGRKSAAQVQAEGPDVIQAGTVNSASISLVAGFSGHPHAWADNEIAYYAHVVSLR